MEQTGLPLTVAPAAGVVRLTTGGVVSGVYVTVNVAVPALLAASFAVTVRTLVPDCRTIPLTDQLVAPLAVPLPPRLLLQVTCVTPTLSDAVPPSTSGLLVVAYVVPVVGVVIATVGGVVSGGGGAGV